MLRVPRSTAVRNRLRRSSLLSRDAFSNCSLVPYSWSWWGAKGHALGQTHPATAKKCQCSDHWKNWIHWFNGIDTLYPHHTDAHAHLYGHVWASAVSNLPTPAWPWPRRSGAWDHRRCATLALGPPLCELSLPSIAAASSFRCRASLQLQPVAKGCKTAGSWAAT